MKTNRFLLSMATDLDRQEIYRIRHDLFATELRQHPENEAESLSDALDAYNTYIVARQGPQLAGFISITPPGHERYSIDRYVARSEIPVAFDSGLYEVRLLSVVKPRRGRALASLLMYAALRLVESLGGRFIVAVGRCDLRGFYRKAGLRSLGRTVRSGEVWFELMGAPIRELRERITTLAPLVKWIERTCDWDLPMPYDPEACCAHGGAFFEAIGTGFETLDRRHEIVNADVLDAWFPPSPRAIAVLQAHLPWLLHTSPPADAEGLIRTISGVRDIPVESLLAGAGSSSLIYLALRHWLSRDSRVLLPDPTYGEYAHILERVIDCKVERLPLSREDGFTLHPAELLKRLRAAPFDLVVLVNPNNPTGRLLPRHELEPLLTEAPKQTRFWIDEAYIDYAGRSDSVESLAAASANVVVCKSLSKVYALSGARAAYLCGPPGIISELRAISPPWAVSLPAQVAAVEALRDEPYYQARYRETHALREQLATQLKRAVPGVQVATGCANFVVCTLPIDRPDAAEVCRRCRERNVFLRDLAPVSRLYGRHTIRIAVKDGEGNRRIVDALVESLSYDTAQTHSE